MKTAGREISNGVCQLSSNPLEVWWAKGTVQGKFKAFIGSLSVLNGISLCVD